MPTRGKFDHRSLFSKPQADFIDAWSPKHNMYIILLNYNALVYIITQRTAIFFLQRVFCYSLDDEQLILMATNMMHVNNQCQQSNFCLKTVFLLSLIILSDR
jgi:hypothetical protein